MTKSFCAKVLLFGEYSVVKGGKGLAAPLFDFCGELSFDPNTGQGTKEKFLSFCEFMKNSKGLASNLDLEKFKNDVQDGLYFESNIPQGAGVGSSGALCAALYDRYSNKTREAVCESLTEILDHMSLMESFYHGSSSGLDPLISYAQRPVTVENRNKVEIVEFSNNLPQLFLINTDSSRKTSALVQNFLQMCENPEYDQKVQEFIEMSDQAIDSFLSADSLIFEQKIYEISKWQFLNLRPMVCERIAKLWLEGIESKKFFLKLCGAGGGGHYLVYKTDPNITLNFETLKIKF